MGILNAVGLEYRDIILCIEAAIYMRDGWICFMGDGMADGNVGFGLFLGVCDGGIEGEGGGYEVDDGEWRCGGGGVEG